MEITKVLRTDVLVIGGGGAALRAAIAAAEHRPELQVMLLTKGALGRSGVTATACSDRMAFHVALPWTEPGGPEPWRYHADDTYRLGGLVSDYDLAELQARCASEAFFYLQELGVPWVLRSDGKPDQFVTDGSAYARACYTGPHTANHIEAALLRRTLELPNVLVVDHAAAAELLLGEGGGIAGVMALPEDGRELWEVQAQAVVLASGGAGQVFAANVFPADCTGDGYAMAYRAGAELVNMEFIQLGLCSTETKLAMSGSMMRALPKLVNSEGEEFLWRYLAPGTTPEQFIELTFDKGASWPVSYEHRTRIIDIAVYYELARGRRVFMDFAANPQAMSQAALPDRIRAWYEARGIPVMQPPFCATPLARLEAINRAAAEWLRERGVDLWRGQAVEVAPAAQHFQGGVKIRTRAETSLPGLYAAGEVAGGQHGANRPGGNALMDCQVFGRIAGEEAAELAGRRRARVAGASRRAALEWLVRLNAGRVPSEEVRAQLQRLMSQAASVVRTQESLEHAISTLQELKNAAIGPGAAGVVHAVETANLLEVAEMILRAALMRDESRGPHLRFRHFEDLEPLPREERWDRYIVISKLAEAMHLEPREPVRPPQ